MVLAGMARWAAIFGVGRDYEEGGEIFGLILIAILAPIAATIVQMAISRSRKYLVDEGGAHISGKPSGLANAPEKLSDASEQTPNANPSAAHLFIVKPFTGRSMANLFSTHPPVEKRVKRLRAMRQI
ncbi:MAG: M48 family metalloprotease [Syntrophales bacterium]|nr:M48 family metalloprotease [Syntrophales bacterium]